MKKRVLVTGGAGFIGSHMCDLFLGKGYEVICADNFITGSMANIRHMLKEKDFLLLKRDVTRPFDIKGPLHYLLHLASPASPPDYLRYPLETLEVGSLGTRNALETAKKKRSAFLLASTSEVYGDPLRHPQDEGYWGNVNPVGPRSVYDEAKRYAEAVTMAYRTHCGVDTHIVRIFNTYGERMRPNDGRAIPNFIGQALKARPITVYGDGSQTRSFCYVSDMTAGIYKLLTSGIHTPVNIGNPSEMTVLELAGLIIKLTGSKSRVVFKKLPVDDPKVRRPDIARAASLLKWAPKVPLERGLIKTIEYFRGI
ncbi:MAG: UDP-glucuronic acid decarboxylase family protein [Candidatus Omnitrophota bacterium]